MAELTAMLDMSSWPAGMRVIVRKRPPSRAQLRFTDRDGLRLTAFATNTTTGQLAALGCATVAGPAAKTASVPPGLRSA